MQQTSVSMPERLKQWVSGQITLKDIKGYSDEELEAISRVGYFFLMQGKTEEARVIFEGLIALDPRNDYYYRALGTIFQRRGDNERAIKQFGYAIRINPESPYAYVNRAEIYMLLDQIAEAEDDLRQALGKIGNEEQPLSKKAWALYQLVIKRKKEALFPGSSS